MRVKGGKHVGEVKHVSGQNSSICEWQPRGERSVKENGELKIKALVFPHNYPLNHDPTATNALAAAATPSKISATGETTNLGSTQSPRKKLSSNQSRGQSTIQPISEREGVR